MPKFGPRQRALDFQAYEMHLFGNEARDMIEALSY